MTCLRVLAAVIPAAMLVSACSLQESASARPDEGRVGGPAPRISATSLSGEAIDTDRLRGHPVVIDFWASWCGPCRLEQPEINSLRDRYAPRGVHFLGVDMRDGAAEAGAYARTFGVRYPSVPDPDQAIAARYDVAAPPEIVVVGPAGTVSRRFLGTTVGVADLLDPLTARAR